MNYSILVKIFRSFWFWVLLVFVLATGIRCLKFIDKEHLFLDEHLSVILSTYNTYGWTEEFKDDSTVYTGRELKAILLSDDNSLKSIFQDVRSLRNSTRDDPHTNLYYSFLRISFWGADTTVFDQILMRGFILNLLLFACGFFLLCGLSRKLFSNKILVICTLAIAFLNPASIANTLFFRPYQLQETILVLFSFVFVLCYLSIQDRVRFDTWKNMLLIAIATALVFLSGYFAVFYVIILGFALVFFSYKKKQKYNISFLICTLVLSYIFVLTVYSNYNSFLIAERGTQAIEKLGGDGVIENILLSIEGLAKELCSFFLDIYSVGVLVLSVAFVFMQRRKGNNQDVKSFLPLLLSGCALFWILIVFILAPYKAIRYGVSALPIVSLFIPFVLSYFDSRKQQFLFVLFFVFTLSKGILKDDIYWGIPYVKVNCVENQKVPMLIVNSDSIGQAPWVQALLIPYWADDRIVEFSSEKDSFSKIEKYDDVYVFAVPGLSENCFLPEGYKLEDVPNKLRHFNVYRVKRK
ncbi:hypothetical protein [Dysgonomonas sp. ZJ709]|uniref:hypothetical protein n=1 Tax=Dysgonomonas sp. ZJ709 TaxID=2709797 RepID=UPI0013EDB845|nr:hypothetical protein [Dysgonomonas sp. ZJ709]